MFNHQQPTNLIVTQVLSKDMAWQLPAEVAVLEDVGDVDDVEHAHIHLNHSENPLGVSRPSRATAPGSPSWQPPQQTLDPRGKRSCRARSCPWCHTGRNHARTR